MFTWSSSKRGLSWSALAGLALLAGSLAPGYPARADKAKTEAPVEAPKSEASMEDQAFDRYVDLKPLPGVCESLDSAALTDLALQLAEGERVLLRTHRSGISSSQLFSIAIKLATEQRDPASLERLAKAAARAGQKDVEARIALVKKIASSPARSGKPLMVSLDKVDEDNLQTHRHLQAEIHKARMMANKEELASLIKSLPEWLALTEDQRDHLKQRATEAMKDIPAKVDPATELLRKLSGSSRGSLAIQTEAGSGTLTKISTGGGLIPAAVCNLRNASNKAILFTLIGSGRSYWLQPGKSGNFTVYGKFIDSRLSSAQINVVAIDLSGQPSATILAPILHVGNNKLKLADGYWNIINTAGPNSFAGNFYLRRR